MKKILASILATGLLAGSAAAMADTNDWHHGGNWRGGYAHNWDRGEHRGWDRGNHWGNRDWRGYTYSYETPAYGYVTPYYYRHHHHHRYDRQYYRFHHYGY